MIVTCPKCRTRYRVDLRHIGAIGRQVRCRSCRHAWHQMPVAETEEEARPPKPAKTAKAAPKTAPKTAPKPPPKPAPKPDPLFDPPPAEDDFLKSSLDGDLDLGAPVEDEDPFESRLARRRLMMGDGPPMPRRGLMSEPDRPPTPVLVWAGFAGLVLFWAAAGGSFLAFKDTIAMAVPQTAAIYGALAQTLGMPELAVNVRGLIFRGVDHARGWSDGEAYLSVTGSAVNITDGEVPVPPVRVAFHDETKHRLDVQLVQMPVDHLGPRLSTRFGARLTHLPENVAFVEVSFARPEDLPPGGLPPLPAPSGEAPAAAEGAAAEGHGAPPPAGEMGTPPEGPPSEKPLPEKPLPEKPGAEPPGHH